MTNDPSTESSALVGIKMVTTKFAAGHATNSVDEIGAIQVLKSVLIRIVGVGPTVELVGRRILAAFLITSVLGSDQHTSTEDLKENLLDNLPR